MKKIISIVISISIVITGLSVISFVVNSSPYATATEFAQELKELNGEAEYRLIVGSNKRINTLGAVGTACGPNGTYVLQFDSKESAKKAYEYYSSLSYVKYAVYDNVEDFNTCEIEDGSSFEPECVSTVDTNIDDAIKLINKIKGNSLPVIKVGILDCGVARNKVTEDRLLGGYTYFAGKNADGTSDSLGHGTKVAGTIIKNTLENIKLYSYQINVNNTSSEIKLSNIISALYLAAEDGCKVINCSFGVMSGNGFKEAFDDAISNLAENGVIVVAGAGNESTENKMLCPSCCKDSISVGATDASRKLCSFSNYGSIVDTYATGRGLTSININGAQFDNWQGTSAASPVISSICALLAEIKPDITIDEIKELLLKTGISTNENEMNDSHRLIADAYGCVKELTGQELETCDLDFEIDDKTITFSSDTENAEIYYFNNSGGSVAIPYKEIIAESCYKATLNELNTAKYYIVIACAYAPGKAKSKVELLKIPVYDYEFGYLINEANATNQYNIFSRCEITDEKTMIVPEKINGIEVQEIGSYCYMGNQTVETIILPETVKQIDYYAFANCPNLKTVIAPGVEYCERYAFYDCPNLRNVEIPLVTDINTALFKNCMSLTCLDIGEIETVYNHGFKNCSLDLNNKEHNYKISSFSQIGKDTIISYECSKCKKEGVKESFSEHINQNYPPLDVTKDGIVNAKDYACLLRNHSIEA